MFEPGSGLHVTTLDEPVRETIMRDLREVHSWPWLAPQLTAYSAGWIETQISGIATNESSRGA